MPLMLRFVLANLFPRLLESYKDFEERKVASDFTRQASALATVCRAFFKQIPNSNEKLHKTCAKLVRELIQKYEIADKAVLKEIWQLYTHIERAGNYHTRYSNFLRFAASQVLISLNASNVELFAEMLVAACSASLSDARLAVEMISQIFM
ncbi:unnamed protein product, partial [Gongylonema pulchrum]|uniref:MOR2-PAG1_N domain-containing protein n=1 Tax=Gongylonema pulchrum TaxID=637853 RepID=A0A183EPE1_9BILA